MPRQFTPGQLIDRGKRPPHVNLPLIALALLLALMVACRPEATPTPGAKPPGLTGDFFPLQVGMRWQYDTTVYGSSSGPRTASSTVAVCRVRDTENNGRLYLLSTCAEEDLIQAQFLAVDGVTVTEPLVVNREGDPKPRQPASIIARTDMRIGQAWRWEGLLDGDAWRGFYRVANLGKVWTPAGEFNAVRLIVNEGHPGAISFEPGPHVQTTANEGFAGTVERWYAPGVGLVKESGLAIVPNGEGGSARIELTRVLRQYGSVDVALIPCCQKFDSLIGAR